MNALPQRLLLAITDRDSRELKAALQQQNPAMKIYTLEEDFPADEIEYAVLWKQPPGLLAQLPALRGVTSLGAGVDFILNDPDLPEQLPVARVVAMDLRQQMAQYVSAVVTRFHRRFPEFEALQQQKKWQVLPLKESPVVGFAGFGQLASYAAKTLQPMGYRIASWTRHKPTEADESFTGPGALEAFLRRCDFVINLLPLTPETDGLFNRDRFCAMRDKQPVFVHLGRGPQVVETELTEALDAGWLRHAVLDVFTAEPLPAESPLWSHPKVTITPHLAARSDASQTAAAISRQLQALAEGQPLPLQVDRQRAY